MLRSSGIVILLMAGWLGCATESKLGPTGGEEVHLFLLAGQSNMAGRGEVTADRREPIPGVMALQRDGSWDPALDPIHWDKGVAGVGLARSFAQAYLRDHPGVTVGFIPAACGGSSVEVWAPGVYFEPTSGFPYDDAIARVRAVRSRGKLMGVLWHQGEADGNPGRIDHYARRLPELFARFRRDLGEPNLPIVMGQLGQFPGKLVKPERERANEIHREVAGNDPRIVLVSSAGLSAKDDMVHFNAASLDEFGERYARAWRELQETVSRSR
ncbi:sialate O-acetylesterase [Opitutaceae bacterium]|nr:sialate O-acetylesterase [Opitutaceae bacterium]